MQPSNFLAGIKLASFRIWYRFNDSMTQALQPEHPLGIPAQDQAGIILAHHIHDLLKCR